MLLRQAGGVTQQSLQINFPTDWLSSLSAMLKSLQGTEFRRVRALCVALAGDFEGGMMLRELLYLLPKSKRTDGAVYKSAPQWQQELGLTARQVYRVNKSVLPNCGFEITLKKANGVPTPHYRLNAWQFIQRVSDVLRRPAYYLLLKMHKASNGFVQNVEMDLYKTSKSLTTESPTIKTANDVVKNNVVPSVKVVDFKSPLPQSTPEQVRVIELLKKAHVPGQSAVSFALLPEHIVQDSIASAQSAFDAKRTKNRVGYLIGALRKQLQAHKTQPSSESVVSTAPPPNPLPIAAERYAVDEPENAPESHSQESWLDVVRRLREPQAVEAESVNERLQVLVNERTTAQYAWTCAYHQLELQLDRASFDSWLRQAKLLDYEDGVFVVGVHNSYARDMLQHRFYKNVARILRDVTGREMTVRFEADEQSTMPGHGLRRFLRTEN